ncbi:plasmid replication protein RepC [Hoeflea alexandrii]|uniref:plasmid replication protein RepC n=1 Tax=Hoeflea alexandrii TaxID=288436 RepID=UPI003610F1D0
MQLDHITTPFGRRTMTYAMLADQMTAAEIDEDACADKWKIYQALCEARPRLGITDRALAVLSALISFYPKSELAAGDSLIVFPSNAQLSRRANGMAEQTIRRHLAVLVSAGLLTRKDSANGKRFARRGRAGEIDEAFGFSLKPLLARAGEIAQLAAEVEAERLHMRRMKERLTICRRDVLKLIETALEEGAAGDWLAAQDEYRAIFADYPRKPSLEMVTAAIEAIEFLRENILNQLETQLKTTKSSGNAPENERHKQNSNPYSPFESELALEKRRGGNPDTLEQNEAGAAALGMGQDGHAEKIRPQAESLAGVGQKPFPLGMVLSACREISDYGPGGTISSWRDLMGAAVVVRSMLGVSPSAYEEACAVFGPENAATIIACILERAGHINSAGGYLRDLTSRAERGEFSLGPMLMAQIRANGPSERRAG